MSSILTGKVLIAQSGGPTAVINQSLVGAVLESRKFPQVTRVYGALNGVRGIINEDLVDLTQETTNNLELVALTPSSALYSTRDKPDYEYCRQIFEVLRAHEIRYFFYIGGNDSADTACIVEKEAQKAEYDLRIIHIPKTIDNDLVLNDHTPGFPSAARFVAQAFMGINLDNASLPGVHICVVMGRNAGFLTCASAMARKYPDDGPHLIYIPEKRLSVDVFLKEAKEVYDRFGRCIVAMSEGVCDESGEPIATRLARSREQDAHGNVQLSGTTALGDLLTEEVKEKLGIKRVRADTFGYLQRSFAGCVSDIDQNEALEVGEKAAQFAIWHNVNGSITIQRTGNYSVDYRLVGLGEVAGKTRLVPEDFYDGARKDVTEKFYIYCRPLLGSGFPQPHRLRAPKVPKILVKR